MADTLYKTQGLINLPFCHAPASFPIICCSVVSLVTPNSTEISDFNRVEICLRMHCYFVENSLV